MRWLFGAALLIGLYAALTWTPQPSVVLWVWERPEDVSRVDPNSVGLAVLAGSFEIDSSGMRFRPRLQPVQLPEGAVTTAVFRVDVEEGAPLPVDQMTARILSATPPSAAGLQVDFDARLSERTAYRNLLQRLRDQLPKKTKLSMTALAAWCLDDGWIRELPVDEAVPMLFRMGPDAAVIRNHLSGGGEFRVPLCRGSVGLALDESVARIPRGVQRVYVFSPRQWDQRSLTMASNMRMIR